MPKNIQLFSCVGLYDSEKIIDNEFLINVQVCSENSYDGQHFMDYSLIVDEVHLAFNQGEMVLENIAQTIIKNLKIKLIKAQLIEVEISKCNPPILHNKVGQLGVKMSQKF
jgi:dihydroneopterin aldolase